MVTKREREIINLIYQGLTAKEISHSLYISEHTVNTHCKNIMRKLGVRNKVTLVRLALSKGLIDTLQE